MQMDASDFEAKLANEKENAEIALLQVKVGGASHGCWEGRWRSLLGVSGFVSVMEFGGIWQCHMLPGRGCGVCWPGTWRFDSWLDALQSAYAERHVTEHWPSWLC